VAATSHVAVQYRQSEEMSTVTWPIALRLHTFTPCRLVLFSRSPPCTETSGTAGRTLRWNRSPRTMKQWSVSQRRTSLRHTNQQALSTKHRLPVAPQPDWQSGVTIDATERVELAVFSFCGQRYAAATAPLYIACLDLRGLHTILVERRASTAIVTDWLASARVVALGA